jgi:hypothetical protein
VTATPARAADGPSELSLVVIQLMKGAVHRDDHERLWEPLMRLRSRVSDYVGVLGLRLEVDESDGHAYLRSLPDGVGETPFPRLVARHTLPFHVSLLLALLRKRLAEFDASSAEARLVLSREQVMDMLRLYMPESSDEVKTTRAVETHIRRVEELGFLRRLRGSDDQFEVRRILRAFVDGQWLSDLDRRLAAYVASAAGGEPGGAGEDEG